MLFKCFKINRKWFIKSNLQSIVANIIIARSNGEENYFGACESVCEECQYLLLDKVTADPSWWRRWLWDSHDGKYWAGPPPPAQSSSGKIMIVLTWPLPAVSLLSLIQYGVEMVWTINCRLYFSQNVLQILQMSRTILNPYQMNTILKAQRSGLKWIKNNHENKIKCNSNS